jgi:hypothetical protein
MSYCLDVNCKKSIPGDSVFCPYCGGQNFSKEDPSNPNPKTDEISIENFLKVTDSTDAVKEKSVRQSKSKPSLDSQFAVRMNAIGRKMPKAKRSGWSPGQAARKRNFFIAVIVGSLAVFFVIQSQSNPVKTIKSAAVKVLPGSEAYKVGYETGRNMKSEVDHNDEFINQWGPEMRTMLDQLGQSSDNMTQDMIGNLAEGIWPIAAFQAGIMENSAANVADFRRGMIDGYFN